VEKFYAGMRPSVSWIFCVRDAAMPHGNLPAFHAQRAGFGVFRGTQKKRKYADTGEILPLAGGLNGLSDLCCNCEMSIRSTS